MGKSKGVSQDFFNFIKPAQIPSYIEPTKQADFLHVSGNNLFLWKSTKQRGILSPHLSRQKWCFVSVFSENIFPPHLSSHRGGPFFNMISENKLFLLEMTKTATVRLTESVRTMAVLRFTFSRHRWDRSRQFHLPGSECCSSGRPTPFDFLLSSAR